ncbi:MAG: hypothetical protein IT254_03465 [Chitinophagaceae bacterium]|mgnify:CR=1 FL=1|nr:hypothetical protein [Chitinophagaceae bacterium]
MANEALHAFDAIVLFFQIFVSSRKYEGSVTSFFYIGLVGNKGPGDPTMQDNKLQFKRRVVGIGNQRYYIR